MKAVASSCRDARRPQKVGCCWATIEAATGAVTENENAIAQTRARHLNAR
jgi:hypothetical protein